MAGFMDDMKMKMGDMGDDMKARFEELKSQENSGQIDDKGREELQKMREQFEK